MLPTVDTYGSQDAVLYLMVQLEVSTRSQGTRDAVIHEFLVD